MTSTPDEVRGGRGWLLLATSLGFAVIQLDVSVVNVAIRPIGAALGGGVSGLQWVVSTYTVAFAALILSAGALGDRLGARRVFLAGFALFTVTSVACGVAPNLAVLIDARGVQGIGAAILAPASLSLLNHAFTDGGQRARAAGLWAAGASVALAGGPLVGGILTATLGWRAIFFINVPIGVVGIVLTVRFATETSRARDRALDLPGQLLAVATLILLAGATIEGGAQSFSVPTVLVGYALAAITGTGFVLIEARRTRPMLPLRLFRSGTFSAATTIGLLINVAFYGLIFVFSLFFQQSQGLSTLQTGLAFAPATIAILAANLLAGRVDKRFGAKQVMTVGALLTAIGCATLLGANAHSPYPALVAQLICLGFGLGLVVPAMTAALLGSVERSRSGIASGTLNTARQTGSVLGVALFGSLIATGLVTGLRIALGISIALALLAGVLTVLMPKDNGAGGSKEV